MQRSIIKNSLHHMPILLIICGGPIGQSSEKTGAAKQTTPAATTKQPKTSMNQKNSFTKREK